MIDRRSRWQVRIAIIGVFIIGVLAGALTLDIYRKPASSDFREVRRGDEGRRGGRFEQVINQLNLTQEQRSQVDTIFEDARTQVAELRKESEPRFSEVRKMTDERLKKVLTEEQWQQFEKMMSESRGRGRRGRRGPH
jgi:Spy/CpxP family protein refolding chaperone